MRAGPFPRTSFVIQLALGRASRSEWLVSTLLTLLPGQLLAGEAVSLARSCCDFVGWRRHSGVKSCCLSFRGAQHNLRPRPTARSVAENEVERIIAGVSLTLSVASAFGPCVGGKSSGAKRARARAGMHKPCTICINHT
ncbi:hypothetical protein B0J12DRAFT_426565 [Macrophomina phaseolina]|uniref:Secreted protein n=1 Tax=Macrophomina phaseolina TaxID=35725 RepID=A0ABQ8GJE7_9PEZI|nr:hypothetical protein B0J12DRAFT_426565 [Macrophomina phaseolina]